MPPGEGQGRGRGRVSAGEGGGGRPAGSLASSSRAGGGACPRRLLPLGSAPALGTQVRVGASKRVCSPSSSLSPVVRTGLGRRRLSGSLASRCGPSGWERRRSARARRRRLRAPRRHFNQSAARVDGCVVLPAPRVRLSVKPRPTAARPPPSLGGFRAVLISGLCQFKVGRGWAGGAAAGCTRTRRGACETHVRGLRGEFHVFSGP